MDDTDPAVEDIVRWSKLGFLLDESSAKAAFTYEFTPNSMNEPHTFRAAVYDAPAYRPAIPSCLISPESPIWRISGFVCDLIFMTSKGNRTISHAPMRAPDIALDQNLVAFEVLPSGEANTVLVRKSLSTGCPPNLYMRWLTLYSAP